jgi:CelD/BcsL family acetyltransferase involved in cellulose biosynthesis
MDGFPGVDEEGETEANWRPAGLTSKRGGSRIGVDTRVEKIVSVLSRSDILILKEPWRDLARRACGHSMAQTFEYGLTAVDQELARGRPCYLLEVWEASQLVGVWGLTLCKDALHGTLKPFSCGSDEEYSGPLLDARCEAAVAEQILRLAVSMKADRLKIYNTIADGAVDAAATALPLRQSAHTMQACVVNAAQAPTWGDVEKRLSSGNRNNLRRFVRRLRENFPDGSIDVGWSHSIGESQEILKFIFDEKRRWLKEKGLRSLWLNGAHVEEFFGRLLVNANLREHPVIASIRVDGKPIAAILCLNSLSKLDSYITVFDPTYRLYAPSKLLVKFLMTWALERKRDFDFGITLADYKEEWPIEIRTYRTRTIYLTLRGRSPNISEILGASRKRLASVRQYVLGWRGGTGPSSRQFEVLSPSPTRRQNYDRARRWAY